MLGVYILKSHSNNIDTLFINKDGSYLQKIYYPNGELFGTNIQKWNKYLWSIEFTNFYDCGYKNLGKFSIPKSKVIPEISLISSNLSIERKYGFLNFCIYLDKDLSIYYEKVR